MTPVSVSRSGGGGRRKSDAPAVATLAIKAANNVRLACLPAQASACSRMLAALRTSSLAEIQQKHSDSTCSTEVQGVARVSMLEDWLITR